MKTETIFFDKDDNVVEDPDDAIKFVSVEYDDDNYNETFGTIDKKK